MSNEFTATLKSGREVEIEVYYDDQAGVEPGWCWRGKGEDSVYAGGDTLDGYDTEEEAVEAAKAVWGVN